MSTLKIESASQEPALVMLACEDDPTDTPPEFALTPITATSPDGGWVAGEWVGDWTSGRVTARTPTIGAEGAGLEIDEHQTYRLWVRWGSVVKRAATVTAD